MARYTADFETCTWLPNETYVWAWAVAEIGNTDNIVIGNSIETFFDFIFKNGGKYYFHNLKFDCEFILYHLLKNNYEYIADKKDRRDKTFTTLISDMGVFYSLEIYYMHEGKLRSIKILDSLKIIPLSVDELPKAFGLTINKLKLDYDTPREKGYELKDYEKDYITNDVKIVALCLEEMFKIDLTQMTIGSNALKNFKETKGIKTFSHLFPKLSRALYEDIKKCYRGGFTYLNPIYEEVDNEETYNLDVNSLYPSCMVDNPMPFGTPIFFEGKYQEDKVYPLYIQRLTCSFKIKKDHIPTIQIKNTLSYADNEYLETTNGEVETLTLTSVDLKLFFEQYDVDNLKYICGWKFKSLRGIFDDYIYYWINVKNEATITGNKGLRQIAKLLLNSLYGKFATKMRVQNKIPYLEDDIVKYQLSEEGEKDGIYIPIGCFITSYARDKTIRTSQAIKSYSINKYGKDMYIYSDTDSIKTLLPIEELEQFCDIDPIKLGAWKFEGKAIRSRFIRQKTYLEEFINDKGERVVDITCAGMPKECYKYVEWEKFKVGFSCEGKLNFTHVKGGVKLVPEDFTIKGKKLIRNIKAF